MVTEQLRAIGHTNVTAAHASTLELTTDSWLTPAGDCIVGIEASKAPAEFSPSFIQACQNTGARIVLTLSVDSKNETIVGHGHPDLTFTDSRSMVVRTSEYIDDRTVMVGANKAAGDLDRDLVSALQSGIELTAKFNVEP